MRSLRLFFLSFFTHKLIDSWSVFVVSMSGCQSRYFHRSTVSPGFINHPTSSTSGRLNFKERFKRKRQRVNVILPVPNPAPRGDECVTTACSICLNNILEPAGLTCNHIFCFGCITEWARTTATTCPLCKQVNNMTRPLCGNE